MPTGTCATSAASGSLAVEDGLESRDWEPAAEREEPLARLTPFKLRIGASAYLPPLARCLPIATYRGSSRRLGTSTWRQQGPAEERLLVWLAGPRQGATLTGLRVWQSCSVWQAESTRVEQVGVLHHARAFGPGEDLRIALLERNVWIVGSCIRGRVSSPYQNGAPVVAGLWNVEGEAEVKIAGNIADGQESSVLVDACNETATGIEMNIPGLGSLVCRHAGHFEGLRCADRWVWVL